MVRLTKDELDLLRLIDDEGDEHQIPRRSTSLRSLSEKKLVYFWENAQLETVVCPTPAGRQALEAHHEQ